MTTAWWRPFVRTETVFFLVLWLLLWYLLAGQAYLDPGALWHSAVGDRMIETGQLIEKDPFSFTFGGQPWLPHQWLAELIEAGLYRWAGWDGIFIAGITLLAWVYGWIAGRFVKAGCHWLAAVPVLVVALAASRFHYVMRPHLITVALLGWTVGRLCDVEAGRAMPRSLWWAVPVYVLWTNLHGGMLGGVATMGLAAAGWTAALWLGWPTPLANYRQAVEVFAVVIACGLTMFVTPYGAGVAKVWLTIMSAGLSQLVVEHMSLWTIWEDPGRRDMVFRAASAMFALALLLGFALANSTERRLRVTWLLPLAWLVLSITSVRHIPLFTVTAAVVLAELLPKSQMLAEWQWIKTRRTEKENALAPWAVPALAVLAAFGVAAYWRCSGRSDPDRGGCFVRMSSDAWPLDLLDDLRHRNSETTRIFNEDLFGGFLMRYVPSLPVFIDDRYEIYGNKAVYFHDGHTFLQEYVEALVNRPERLEDWKNRYQLNLALTRRFRNEAGVLEDSSFGKYLRTPKAQADGWRLVKEVDAAALFEWRPRESPHD